MVPEERRADRSPSGPSTLLARVSTGIPPSAECREPYSPLLRSIASRRPAAFSAWTESNRADRKSTRLNSSHEWISYAVFCLKKKKEKQIPHNRTLENY